VDIEKLHEDFERLMPGFKINGMLLESGSPLKVAILGRIGGTAAYDCKIDEYFVLPDTVEELVRNVKLRLIELIGGYYDFYMYAAKQLDKLRERLGKEI
jgi:hypothetical protein